MIKHTAAGLFFIAFSLLPSVAFSTVFDATWSNGLSFQKDLIDTTRPLLGYDENLMVSLKKVNQTDVSFFSDIDYAHGYASPGKHPFEINTAYLEWAGLAKCVDLRLGRQRNYEANTPVYLDGLKVQSTFKDRLVLTGFAGRPLSSRYSNESLVSRVDTTDLDLSLRADYLVLSSRAGIIYQRQMNTGGTLAGHDIGFFVSHDFSEKWYARGNAVYNISSAAIRNFQVTTSYQWSDKLLLDASGSEEAWKIDSSSLFERKIYSEYREGALHADYAFTDKRSGSLGVLLRQFNHDSLGEEISARISVEPVSLMLRQDFGFGGAVTMADISASHRCTRLLGSSISAGLVRYQSPGTGAPTHMAYSSSLSLDLGPETAPWGVNLETQVMRNAFYEYDARAYINTVYRFSKFYK